ncbi:hypothetical protein EZV62_020510 [Acer yangbiense]|uniref:Wound-responsive family protein n=1 Tax=Acer yangbiense TaxID=1000413 RepID=A0A5C7HE20_9ROSI|nr:hypothetical protein EZV62_020510 [Acer yangbiense]
MSAKAGKALIVAASIGAVEALKDQGFARWNQPLRSLKQHAETNVKSLIQAKKLSSSSVMALTSGVRDDKTKEPEESLRKVMFEEIYCIQKMSSTSRAWMVATSIAAVEALKDQGFCRWNYPIRALHQQAKNNLRSASQAKKLSSSSSAALVSTMVMRSEDKAKQSEESLRKVMYLSCWGPN